MVVELAKICAPVAVLLGAAAKLPGAHISYAPKRRQQKRLYSSLLLFEKLPDGVAGRRQISADIDRQTLRLAYLSQYPQRAAEILRISIVGAILIAILAFYYLFLWADVWLLYLLVLIGIATIVMLYFRRAVGNFAANDTRHRELFERLGAPVDLAWAPTDLYHRTPPHSAQHILQRAVDVRDFSASPMTTVAAVNAALAQTASERRHPVAALAINTLAFMAKAYDWLLEHLLGPFFRLRVWYLDETERQRVTHAEKTGDVFAAAWLPTHFRNERERVTGQLAHLHHARDPLLKWVDRMTLSISTIQFTRLYGPDGSRTSTWDTSGWVRRQPAKVARWGRRAPAAVSALRVRVGNHVDQLKQSHELRSARRRVDAQVRRIKSSREIATARQRVGTHVDRIKNSRELRGASGWVRAIPTRVTVAARKLVSTRPDR